MSSTRSELIFDALEESRREVVKRLRATGHPLAIDGIRTIVVESDTGWGTQSKRVTISGFQSLEAQFAIRDDDEGRRLLVPRRPLESLANHLNGATDLGTRPYSIGPSLLGTEAIMVRYLSRLSYRYLTLLKRLDRADRALAKRLISDFEKFCDSDETTNLTQITLSGIRPRALYTYRGITIRSLTPEERGTLSESVTSGAGQYEFETDFVAPFPALSLIPSSIITIYTSRPKMEVQNVLSSLPSRVVLALYLSGYELSSNGEVVSCDQPNWLHGHISGNPFPVYDKGIIPVSSIGKSAFLRIVDLAYRIPDFSERETNSREIALYRVLKGCGKHRQESAFLDFVIALEATLLSNISTELSYRFRLYGAIFLKDHFDPDETFKKLKLIYDVRSRLVHGSAVKHEELLIATESAKEMAKAVVRVAVESVWPDPGKLDEKARASRKRESHN